LILTAGNSHSSDAASCALPGDFGEVVCRFNEKSPNQLYIIGMAHRDSLTWSNDSRTPRVQAEVYKIGEWLIRNQGVELLLPEGFFAKNPDKAALKKSAAGSLPGAAGQRDMNFLEQRLSDDRRYVNAEMLLRDDFPMSLRQVEDRDLYQTALDNIRLLAGSRGNAEKSYVIRSELDYHQKKRVGAMLQRIPGIVNDELRQGHIGNRKALFTIGLSHVSDIIAYIEQKKITVLCPLPTPLKHEDYVGELNLAREDFGISIIIPRTLLDDQEVMAKNNLKVY
jgi:hypothetical protein